MKTKLTRRKLAQTLLAGAAVEAVAQTTPPPTPDADLKAANLIIEVKEGVVTLSGNVASAALKSKAEELARGAGAKNVKNQLRVSAGR